jgi:hypothetical protein
MHIPEWTGVCVIRPAFLPLLSFSELSSRRTSVCFELRDFSTYLPVILTSSPMAERTLCPFD